MRKLYFVLCLSLLVMSLATVASAVVNLVENFDGYTDGILTGQTAANGQVWANPYDGSSWAVNLVVSDDHGLTGKGAGGNGNTSAMYGFGELALGEQITAGQVKVGADINGVGSYYHQFGLNDTVSGKSLYIGYTQGIGTLWFDGFYATPNPYQGEFIGHLNWFRLDMVLDLDNRMANIYWSGEGGEGELLSGTWGYGPWADTITFNPNKFTMYTYQYSGGGPSTASFDNLTIEMVPEPGSLLALGTGIISLAGFAVRRRK